MKNVPKIIMFLVFVAFVAINGNQISKTIESPKTTISLFYLASAGDPDPEESVPCRTENEPWYSEGECYDWQEEQIWQAGATSYSCVEDKESTSDTCEDGEAGWTKSCDGTVSNYNTVVVKDC